MSATKRDYYEVLGVARGVDKDDIKKAFRRLARQFHPDVNKAPEAEAKFKEINEAYEVLSDDQKRALYDRYGHAAVNGQGGGGNPFEGMEGFPFGDLFETFFGGATSGRGGGGRRAQRGSDRRYAITLEFREAIFGAERDVEIERLEQCEHCQGQRAEPGSTAQTCPQCKGAGEVRRVQQTLLGQFVSVAPCDRCHGEGRIITSPCKVCRGEGRSRVSRTISVTIPAGADDSMQLRLSGQGDAGLFGGPSGNLLLSIKVKPDPVFQRDEDDLHVSLPINVVQAALGAEVMVPTVDEPEKKVEPLILRIPEGTQNGRIFTFRDRGVPRLRSTGRGDLIVSINVVTPAPVTAEQRQLLEQLGAILPTPTPDHRGQPGDKGFFGKLKDVLGGD